MSRLFNAKVPSITSYSARAVPHGVLYVVVRLTHEPLRPNPRQPYDLLPSHLPSQPLQLAPQALSAIKMVRRDSERGHRQRARSSALAA